MVVKAVHQRQMNENKMKVAEKQVVLCVSIKICHLTHFTRLAYKDMNEVIVSDFLGWYADQTSGRSSQTNTFLEQVPNIAETFDMSTWVRHKSMGSPVKPGVKTSNDDDIYVFMTGTISIDLLPLFTATLLPWWVQPALSP
jgi:hypothetical protein